MNFVRSAIAPETIVAAVAANTVWKIRNVQFQSPLPGSTPLRPNIVVPIQPLLCPNIRPKPTKKKASMPIEKSNRFFIRMLTEFLARVNPVSTMANPACMKNTRNAATSVQTMLRFVWTSALATSMGEGSAASAAHAGTEIARMAKMIHSLHSRLPLTLLPFPTRSFDHASSHGRILNFTSPHSGHGPRNRTPPCVASRVPHA